MALHTSKEQSLKIAQQNLPSPAYWASSPLLYSWGNCMYRVFVAFVPAPPVAPVPAPAPMPPVHPPPPMEDEPPSKKLKTEDSLMPEEEFLRRNKVCDPECYLCPVVPGSGMGYPSPSYVPVPCG